MNIFGLHFNPAVAPTQMYDVHLNKMLIESHQLLSFAIHRHGNPHSLSSDVLASPVTSYMRHPCTTWAALTGDNFYWLQLHATGLNRERIRRGGAKYHKTWYKLVNLLSPFSRYGSREYDWQDATPLPLAFGDYQAMGRIKFARKRSQGASAWSATIYAYRCYYIHKWQMKPDTFNYNNAAAAAPLWHPLASRAA